MERDWPGDILRNKTYYFYPRAPHGARRKTSFMQIPGSLFLSTRSAWSATMEQWSKNGKTQISIHALRMERDSYLPTQAQSMRISIHALRMERDHRWFLLSPRQTDFYPRAPHGARLGAPKWVLNIWDISIHALRMERDGTEWNSCSVKRRFLSTRSAWSATGFSRSLSGGWSISIHALRMERDLSLNDALCDRFPFLSTRSAWSAT